MTAARAASRHPGEIVGLDFDPVLAAQDIGERYEAGSPYRSGSGYRVPVYGVWNGKRNKRPDVVPELARVRGKWMFVNFHYANEKGVLESDLLRVLKELREQRRKDGKR